MTNKEVEDFVNWLQSLTAKKFYSEDAEDLIHEYKNKALSQHDVIKSACSNEHHNNDIEVWGFCEACSTHK